MVQFHSPSRSDSNDRPQRQIEDYRSRRAKLRLMVIVFSLMFVVVMIGEASKPDNWRWITRQPQVTGDDGAEGVPGAVAEESIDPRLDVKPRQPLPPGVFVSQPTIAEPTIAVDDPTAEQSQLGLNLARYHVIKDNTVFRSAETSVWYETLVAIRDLEPATLAGLKPRDATYTQLYRQSDEYRGRAVKVKGSVRRIVKKIATKNEQGIESYYQCWLFPGGLNPIVVYALELPEGLAEGNEVRENVTFDGVFFKRWAYEAAPGKDGNSLVMTAPVVLAYKMDWTAPVVAPRLKIPDAQTIGWVLSGFSLLAVALSYLAYRNSVRSESRLAGYRDQDSDAQAAIDQLSLSEIPTEDELVRKELFRHEDR